MWMAADLRDYGVWVNNSTGVKTGVTMKTSHAWYQNEVTNFQVDGIYIHSSGQVTLDELYLDFQRNRALGEYRRGGDGHRFRCVTSTTGMQISPAGRWYSPTSPPLAVSGQGVSIDNSPAAPAAAVTISKLWVNDNDTGGLRIDSAGAVTITDLYATGRMSPGTPWILTQPAR